jgi:hypothetical protein
MLSSACWSKRVPRFEYPSCCKLLNGHQCYTTETTRHQQALLICAQRTFRMHGSNCGRSSTAKLYASQQYCCICTVKLAAGWSAASPADFLLWFMDGMQISPGAATIVTHPQACRTALHPRIIYYWLCRFNCFTAGNAALCTTVAGGEYCWQSFCAHIARLTFATHGAVSSNCCRALSNPGNPWLPLILFSSKVQLFRALVVVLPPYFRLA